MSALAERAVRGLVLALILGLAAALAYQYVHGLQAKLAAAQGAAATANKALGEAVDTISKLHELAHTRELAVAKLEGERNAIRDAASNREILMRKLQDENAEIRAWAAAAVPGDVVGLRDHGPLTGAAAYRQFLSQGASLPSARRAGEK